MSKNVKDFPPNYSMENFLFADGSRVTIIVGDGEELTVGKALELLEDVAYEILNGAKNHGKN